MGEAPIRKRRSVQELCGEVELRPEMEKVIRAFAGIQALPPNDPNSFYFLAGFHGEPFRGPNTQFPGPDNNLPDKQNTGQKLWWGGYCNHGNVLFPTWHRAYMHRFEKALQSIKGCEDVMLPFWDECFDMGNWDPYDPPEYFPAVVTQVVPEIFLQERIRIDGEEIKNPLFSYTLQRDTTYVKFDRTNIRAQEQANSRYSKPRGYETCRFPKRGIVSNVFEKAISEQWNGEMEAEGHSDGIMLNINVLQWLRGSIKHFIVDKPDGKKKIKIPDTNSVYSRYQLCLQAPNYTVFSNTTSEKQWVKDLKEKRGVSDNERAMVYSVESPHNAIHLAVGGFFQEGIYNADSYLYQQANGDMGDNETASFDPIFFFHHSFIDYVFWTWQKNNGLTERGSLDVLQDYPGTITDEGSPVGLAPGEMLTMSTPLYPFRPKREKGQLHRDGDREWVTSHDVTNIHELGYDYAHGSLDPILEPAVKFSSYALDGMKREDVKSDVVAFKNTHGINRAEIEGSFVVKTLAKHKSQPGGLEIEVGRSPVLSRLNIRGCKNCQTHLEAESQFPIYQGVLDALGASSLNDVAYRVVIDTHDTAYRLHPDQSLSDAKQLYPTLAPDDEFVDAMSVLRIDDV